MNIIIFGSTGYIGRNLVNGLLEKGHTITAVVRRPTDIFDKNIRVSKINFSNNNEITSKYTCIYHNERLKELGK